MLARAIIDHASPTLARLKLGNLFNIPIEAGFYAELAALRAQLGAKGVQVVPLHIRGGRALIYVYRADELARVLHQADVQALLRGCGYARFEVEAALKTLQARLADAHAFPHEIGVFLGYPLADVIGFIENGGRNCLMCGCWKVYSDACAAQAAFRRYEKCRTVYQRLFASGCPLSRLTVAARPAS